MKTRSAVMSLPAPSPRVLALTASLALASSMSACGDSEPPPLSPSEPTQSESARHDGTVPPSEISEDDSPPRWPTPRPGCNGHEALCDRPFPDVVFPATHNSMSNAEDGWSVPNQNKNMRQQLLDGIRVFLLDTYAQRDEILLCHSACILGKRPLLEALLELRSFLEDNPAEVITIIFEDYITAEQTAAVFHEAELLPLLYTHDHDAGWPTLGEMIRANNRLVVTAQSASPPPAWLHNIWTLGWDTPFSFSSIEDFNCRANRGSPENPLFLVNHWILDPLADPGNAPTVNAYETLMARVDDCLDAWDRLPTFVAVDFHDIGDLMEVVEVLNGVRPPR